MAKVVIEKMVPFVFSRVFSVLGLLVDVSGVRHGGLGDEDGLREKKNR